MEYWEFLIQREGDRGWRPIKTGNLQLMEGTYRIVASSNLIDTQIQTRVTHQTLGSTAPQRRSKSCTQTSNPNGLLVIIPFTHLKSGIWQFVCSGNTTAQTAWHRILKLRVLTRTSKQSPVNTTHPLQVKTIEIDPAAAPEILQGIGSGNKPTQTHTPKTPAHQVLPIEESNEIETPTEPLVPISMVGEQPESWADGLDRLLDRLERDSLKAQQQQPAMRETFPGTIQLTAIAKPPLQLISLDRSTFSGMIPGNHLMISGACNLKISNANLVQTVKIEKLSICLRHPQTSEIIVSIEQSLPANLNTFTFRGQLELPTQPKITLLLGEVNLYDKHNIQIGSSGFTVTLNLNPLHESDVSLLQLFDRSNDTSAETLAQIAQELQQEAATIGLNRPMSHPLKPAAASTIRSINSPQYPTVPLAYKRESLFDRPDIVPVDSSPTSHLSSPADTKHRTDPHQSPHLNPSPPLTADITGDLEIEFADATFDSPLERLRQKIVSHQDCRHAAVRKYDNLEIVIDD